MLMIATSAISLSRRGVRKFPQGADGLFQITLQMWSMKTIVLRSITSMAPWIIPRKAMKSRLLRSACITRDMTADPKYYGTSKMYEYPGWTIFFKRWAQSREITLNSKERWEECNYEFSMFSFFVVHYINKRCYEDANDDWFSWINSLYSTGSGSDL